MFSSDPPETGNVVMDAGITTVLAATIAVLGTLLSSVLTQRINARSKLKENELAQLERQKEYEREQNSLTTLARRAAYTMLNTEMRKFRRELNNYLLLIRAGAVTDDALRVLEYAHRTYSENYADAQMIVPDEVLQLPGERIADSLTCTAWLVGSMVRCPSA